MWPRVALCLIGSIVLLSVRPALVAQDRPAAFAFQHLTVDDGLSHTTVYTLMQDRLGLVWAGTRFGLDLFDGYTFKTFLPDPADPYAIKSQAVLALTEDAEGNIWVGHVNGGISMLERSTGRFLRFPSADEGGLDWDAITVRRIYIDKAGNRWIGTYGQGAVVFSPDGRLRARFCTSCTPDNRRLSNDYVFDFEEDPNGVVWIGTAGRGINAYTPSTDRIVHIHAEEPADMEGFAKSLCLDANRTLWVGTEGSGLYRIDWRTQRVVGHEIPGESPEAGLSHPIITDVEPDADGHLWISTDGGGLNRYTPLTGTWQHFRYQPAYMHSLNSDALYDLMFDDMGNLWVGTFNGGINIHRAVRSPFVLDRQYAAERASGLRSVLCMDQGPDGRVWLGTDGGGLFELLPDEHPIGVASMDRDAPHPPGENVVTSLVAEADGMLWLGTFARGLCLYDASRGIVSRFVYDPDDPNSLSHNNVWDLERDRDGGLWVGTLGGGVCYLNPGTDRFDRFLPLPGASNSLSGTQVIDILLDTVHQALWVATENAGLNRIDLRSKPFTVKTYRHDRNETNGLSSDRLRCLHLDDQGILWIGTENAGLDALWPATDRFDRYSISDGLPSLMINSIVGGDGDNLWITTQGGIVRMSTGDRRFTAIGDEPFLDNNQYNPAAAIRLHDGRLLFGSTNGFSMIMPGLVVGNPHPPGVILTGLSLSGQDVPIGRWNEREILSGPLNDHETIVRLHYQDKGLRIDFTATRFLDPEHVRFAYRLMGFDTVWREVGADQRHAVFSNLPGGEYELQVRAANRDGIWTTSPRTLRVRVDPPFWQTWWFIGLSALAGVLLAAGMILFLLARQRKRFQEKNREAEREVLRLKNENLQQDVQNKQDQLSATVLQSAHKNQFLADLKTQIRKMELPDSDLHRREWLRILRAIDQELDQKDYWDQFQLTFNQTHQEFVETLQMRHPTLTATENRLCGFIRMGFSNSEIASILNITVNGVEQSKYRLKLKLDLDKNSSVNDYIRSL